MLNQIISVFAILFYGIAAIWQGFSVAKKSILTIYGVRGIVFSAILIHAMLLYHWIDVGSGQNLTIFNLGSLVSWLVALLVLLASFTKPVGSLGIFIFPLAAVSILLVNIFPSLDIVNTAANPKELWHILLSTLAFSFFCLAGLQAVLLAIQERSLKTKHTVKILQILPPLEVMEKLLFEMIILGFILLSIVLFTSLLSFHPIFGSTHWQKSTLAIGAWCIFATLLLGRLICGWRGTKAIRWTLGGVFMIMVIYYGSEFI